MSSITYHDVKTLKIKKSEISRSAWSNEKGPIKLLTITGKTSKGEEIEACFFLDDECHVEMNMNLFITT